MSFTTNLHKAYKNVYLLLLIIVILAVIIAQIVNRTKRESLTNCTNLSKTKCTKDPDQLALCNYDKNRCKTCYRKTCTEIGNVKDACLYTNRSQDYENVPTNEVTVVNNVPCNGTDNASLKCPPCKNGLCQYGSECAACDRDPTENVYITKSDGSTGLNSYYTPSCDILPPNKVQPYVKQSQQYSDSTGIATGNICVANPDTNTTFVCPNGYNMLQTTPTKLSNAPSGYEPLTGMCVPNNDYTLIEKPNASDMLPNTVCDTSSGFKYDTTTGKLVPCTQKGNYTCKLGKNIVVGKEPWVYDSNQKICVRNTTNPLAVVDYICPEGTISSPKNTPCTTNTKLYNKTLDSYITPCLWDDPSTNTTESKCQPCNLTIKDPNSMNIYCFKDQQNRPMCQHRNYKPSQIECNSVLGDHCMWLDDQCQKKPKNNL